MHIAMLRGINVSGHNLVKMEALRASFATLGFGNAQTYVQSGNVVFEAPGAATSGLSGKIQRQILRDFGNMSSATIMFILQQILQNAMPGQNGIAIAFGPGLAMESMRFTAAARPARSDAQNAGNTRHNRAGPLGITATLPLA